MYDGDSCDKAISTLHCALENGSDLHVNKRQKTRHYRARSTEEEKRMPNVFVFYFARRTHKLGCYSDVIHSFSALSKEPLPKSYTI